MKKQRKLSKSQAKREGQIDRWARHRSDICIVLYFKGGKKRCARRVPKSPICRVRQGQTKDEGTRHESQVGYGNLREGESVPTCSSANDLPMLVCVEKANPPVYAVEWMTISVEAGANG